MITERHFLGFDPAAAQPCDPTCGEIAEAATVIWFEEWIFTYWSFLWLYATGIGYRKAFAAFDELGCFLGVGQCRGLSTVSFLGNETNTFNVIPRDHDAWLALARKSTHADSLPEPGTLAVCPDFTKRIGYRAA